MKLPGCRERSQWMPQGGEQPGCVRHHAKLRGMQISHFRQVGGKSCVLVLDHLIDFCFVYCFERCSMINTKQEMIAREKNKSIQQSKNNCQSRFGTNSSIFVIVRLPLLNRESIKCKVFSGLDDP